MRKTQIKKSKSDKYNSPPPYRTVMSVYHSIPQTLIEELPQFEIRKYRAEFEDQKMMNIFRNFQKGNYFKSKVVESKGFKTFLCDLELFNWRASIGITTVDKIQYFAYGDYTLYMSYLCSQYATDLQFFGRIFSDARFKNISVPYAMVNGTYAFEHNDTDKYASKGINIGKYIHYPITIIKNKDNTFNTFYTDDIRNFREITARYVLVNVKIYFESSGGHFTYFLIDTQTKQLEYYDPHGSQTNPSLASYVHQVLGNLYPRYSINEHWKNSGIQIDQSETRSSGIKEDGFCVIWGCLMLHLKLLNMNNSLHDIELLFIKECAQKRLSLYEVMMNYAHYMTRMIPKDPVKYKILEKIFNK